MPTKNIIETVSAKGALTLRTTVDNGVALNTPELDNLTDALQFDETDINAVLEYAHERRILTPLLKAMPQRQRKPRATAKKPKAEKKAA